MGKTEYNQFYLHINLATSLIVAKKTRKIT